ncbi:Mg2+/citrate transporter [Streptococcus pneumoniae]|jgi:CitMHS family citrate-Mg2+:H+ or citrate-Ca2+:H+ symporter|uniref:Citrate:proton symporter n=1 Tax=Stutzerimonas stutzeri TaxID=316 RepID=A0AA42TFA4_STUST|nr:MULTISPECIES: citrate:proton symporter [Stutzerimonas]OHC21193.1 MAG: citrate transporter [Pseudomonadales bacterium RIFCSPHIGHO2_01_FULL_64_12]CJL01186.1 Mg2+/citrate transporter [Streptococcus pneumoniae]AVX14339.1 citrate transporter [Stutzerimonas stutzeri]MDH1235379.1 citrate:proton symporter [Stutzerimonas stutzeri]MDL2173260.1 citrate:proton symporter [Stutzerimonas sp. FeSN7]
MITALGFGLMFLIVTLILLRRISPLVAFVTLPVIASALAGFGLGEIGKFITEGLKAVAPTATLFIFAILYFGVMRERGLFAPLVNFLLRSTGGKPLAVAVVTVAVTAVTHLDGIGAATFLLVIPALLPLYLRLGMKREMLLCLVVLSAGVMNMVPWGGTTARASAVTGIDASQLWISLIPVQAVGLALVMALAVFLGLRAQRSPLGHGMLAGHEAAQTAEPGDDGRQLSPLSWRYWANLVLTLIILVCLFTGAFPLFACFMVGLGVALVLNYPSLAEQNQAVLRHASDAMQMALVMLAAGILLGVLAGAGMSDGMAHWMINVLPEGSANWLHVIIGAFGVPLGMLFSPDAYYFALLPVIRDVAVAAGVDAQAVASAMLIGENTGFGISPVVPSVYLAIGLAGVELYKHIRYTVLWAWGISLVMLAAAVLFGVVTV